MRGVGRYIVLILLLFSILGCTETKENTQIANPAAEKCVQDGHDYEIRTAPDGSQTGICIIDGTECDAWEYFRGGCP